MTGSMKWGRSLLAVLLFGFVAAVAHANEVEGKIETLDSDAQTLTVQGIEFNVDEQTSYNDGLTQFEDLEVGQRVEVDFDYTDNRHIATEIELQNEA